MAGSNERLYTGAEVAALIAALPTLASGTYTGTLSSVSGINDPVWVVGRYVRVGNVVTVFGSVSGIVSGGTSQIFEVTLPVARSGNFSGTGEACGVATVGGGVNGAGRVLSVSGAQRVRVQLQGTSGTLTSAWNFSFTYSVA